MSTSLSRRALVAPLFRGAASRRSASSSPAASVASAPVSSSDTSTATPPGYVVVDHRGRHSALPRRFSADAWLASLPRGAYVNARTHGRDAVFQLAFHSRKLAESIARMRDADADADDDAPSGEAPSGEAPSGTPSSSSPPPPSASSRRAAELANLTPPPTPEDVACVVEPLMAEALARLRERWPSVEEAKLVAHVAWGANPGAASPAAFPPSVSDSERRAADLIATCAASPLDPPPPRPVYAAFDGAGRSDPAAKDSAWAAERGKRFRSFVEASEEKRAVVAPHELLLVDETTGDVLEGASSNLVAFVDGVAYTADEGVLRGSVRDVALDALELEGVRRVLAPPPGGVPGAARWEGALICSTSRLALPLDGVIIGGGGEGAGEGETVVPLDASASGVAARIARRVEAMVAGASEVPSRNPRTRDNRASFGRRAGRA